MEDVRFLIAAMPKAAWRERCLPAVRGWGLSPTLFSGPVPPPAPRLAPHATSALPALPARPPSSDDRVPSSPRRPALVSTAPASRSYRDHASQQRDPQPLRPSRRPEVST